MIQKTYEYSFAPAGEVTFTSTSFYGNLNPSPYDLVVRDSRQCETPIQRIVITEPSLSIIYTKNYCYYILIFNIYVIALQVDLDVFTNVSCNSGNDGSGKFIVSGGTSPYVYTLSSNGEVIVENSLFVPSLELNGLTARTYHFKELYLILVSSSVFIDVCYDMIFM